MSRYTGPRVRLSRRNAPFGPSKYLERRPYGPGQHGPKGGRRKLTDYALALAEKQKVRFFYGLQEKQFRRAYATAASKRGVTGEIMLQILESRLDSVVFSLGLATTRAAARQMVSHGHILVNGTKVSASSFHVRRTTSWSQGFQRLTSVRHPQPRTFGQPRAGMVAAAEGQLWDRCRLTLDELNWSKYPDHRRILFPLKSVCLWGECTAIIWAYRRTGIQPGLARLKLHTER